MNNNFLTRLYNRIYKTPYASNGKNDDGLFMPMHIMKKENALKHNLIQLNGPRLTTYLSFDIDEPGGAFAWEDANLPVPNCIMVNKENKHAHLVYELTNPIMSEKPEERGIIKPKRIFYLDNVKRAMTNALKADTNYNGMLVKNPFHEKWDIICYDTVPTYSLADLHANIEMKRYYNYTVSDNSSRNCFIFNKVRFFAYKDVYHHTDYYEFKSSIEYEVNYWNDQFTQPLPYSETKSIIKSISDYTWKGGRGKILKNEGILNLQSTGLPLKTKQQLGQEYTVNERTTKTLERYNNIYKDMIKHHLPLTKAVLQIISNTSKNTINRYWNTLVKPDLQDGNTFDKEIVMLLTDHHKTYKNKRKVNYHNKPDIKPVISVSVINSKPLVNFPVKSNTSVSINLPVIDSKPAVKFYSNDGKSDTITKVNFNNSKRQTTHGYLRDLVDPVKRVDKIADISSNLPSSGTVNIFFIEKDGSRLERKKYFARKRNYDNIMKDYHLCADKLDEIYGKVRKLENLSKIDNKDVLEILYKSVEMYEKKIDEYVKWQDNININVKDFFTGYLKAYSAYSKPPKPILFIPKPIKRRIWTHK